MTSLRSVVVVGLGLMGGSVVKAVKKRASDLPVFGIDVDEEALRLALIDGVKGASALADCELAGAAVVFATPLDVTMALLRSEVEHWRRAVFATDVASLKVPVLDAAEGAPFVGSHPMCGSERSGYAAAQEDLFVDKTVWLCGENTGQDGQERIEQTARFWCWLGANPRLISSVSHDRKMSWVSHLPQLLSSALAGALASAGIDPAELGPGGRGMTRLAASSPEMWAPLLQAGGPENVVALREMERQIAQLRRSLEEDDLESTKAIMWAGKKWTQNTE